MWKAGWCRQFATFFVPLVLATTGFAGGPSANAPTAPAVWFANLRTYPHETVDAVFACRTAVEWLSRMNQPSGRFFPGINPVDSQVATEAAADQLRATLALADAARFTGDAELMVRAQQAVLVLLAQTDVPADKPNLRIPRSNPGCDPLTFAATLSRAIDSFPNLAAERQREAEQLTEYLISAQQEDGSFGPSSESGAILSALATSHRLRPTPTKRTALLRGIDASIREFRARPEHRRAAGLLNAVVEFHACEVNPSFAKIAFELADWLCSCQYTRADALQAGWHGSFRPSPRPAAAGFEPGIESAMIMESLANATKLARQVPDLTRYPRYRQATLDALAFTRRLQYTRESAARYDPTFRARYLLGGVCRTPSDPTARPDATAALVLAHLAFLESGAEGGR